MVIPCHDSELITTEELAKIVRAPVETVRYWRHIGKGPKSFKIGRRVLYRGDDVSRWIDEAHRDGAA